MAAVYLANNFDKHSKKITQETVYQKIKNKSEI